MPYNCLVNATRQAEEESWSGNSRIAIGGNCRDHLLDTRSEGELAYFSETYYDSLVFPLPRRRYFKPEPSVSVSAHNSNAEASASW